MTLGIIYVGEHDSSIECMALQTPHIQFRGTHEQPARNPVRSRGSGGAARELCSAPWVAPPTPRRPGHVKPPPRRPSPSPPPQSPARGARTPAESLAWEFKTGGGASPRAARRFQSSPGESRTPDTFVRKSTWGVCVPVPPTHPCTRERPRTEIEHFWKFRVDLI